MKVHIPYPGRVTALVPFSRLSRWTGHTLEEGGTMNHREGLGTWPFPFWDLAIVFHVFCKRELCNVCHMLQYKVGRWSYLLDFQLVQKRCTFFWLLGVFGIFRYQLEKTPFKIKGLKTQVFAVWMAKWAAKKYLVFLGSLVRDYTTHVGYMIW